MFNRKHCTLYSTVYVLYDLLFSPIYRNVFFPPLD